jgi:hypothetical protein
MKSKHLKLSIGRKLAVWLADLVLNVLGAVINKEFQPQNSKRKCFCNLVIKPALIMSNDCNSIFLCGLSVQIDCIEKNTITFTFKA